jgi:hypothetical protein
MTDLAGLAAFALGGKTLTACLQWDRQYRTAASEFEHRQAIRA